MYCMTMFRVGEVNLKFEKNTDQDSFGWGFDQMLK